MDIDRALVTPLKLLDDAIEGIYNDLLEYRGKRMPLKRVVQMRERIEKPYYETMSHIARQIDPSFSFNVFLLPTEVSAWVGNTHDRGAMIDTKAMLSIMHSVVVTLSGYSRDQSCIDNVLGALNLVRDIVQSWKDDAQKMEKTHTKEANGKNIATYLNKTMH